MADSGGGGDSGGDGASDGMGSGAGVTKSSGARMNEILDKVRKYSCFADTPASVLRECYEEARMVISGMRSDHPALMTAVGNASALQMELNRRLRFNAGPNPALQNLRDIAEAEYARPEPSTRIAGLEAGIRARAAENAEGYRKRVAAIEEAKVNGGFMPPGGLEPGTVQWLPDDRDRVLPGALDEIRRRAKGAPAADPWSALYRDVLKLLTGEVVE